MTCLQGRCPTTGRYRHSHTIPEERCGGMEPERGIEPRWLSYEESWRPPLPAWCPVEVSNPKPGCNKHPDGTARLRLPSINERAAYTRWDSNPRPLRRALCQLSYRQKAARPGGPPGSRTLPFGVSNRCAFQRTPENHAPGFTARLYEHSLVFCTLLAGRERVITAALPL